MQYPVFHSYSFQAKPLETVQGAYIQVSTNFWVYIKTQRNKSRFFTGGVSEKMKLNV